MAASTSSSGPVAKRPRISSTDTTSVSEQRRFVPAWKSEFPWVVLVEGAMRCQYCQDSGKHNVFTTGCSKFKKDVLKKHAATNDHHAAVEAKSGRRDMQRAVATAYRQQELAVLAALRTVYFMAKKNLPNNMFSDLKQFQVLQVSALDVYALLFSHSQPFSEASL